MTTETTTETPADVTGLKNNNAALKKERDDWKRRADDAQKLLDEAEDAGDELKTVKRERDSLKTERDSLLKERDTLAADLHSTRVDHAISAAIASGNILPEFVDAAEAILYRKLDQGADTINGKSIADFSKSYFAKEGSKMVRPADNAGADSPGNNGAKAVDYANKPFALGEYQTLLSTNPEGAKAWAEVSGNGYLNS